MTNPKVAILIPAWNEEKTIERAIRSAHDQDYPNKKIIVAVDNSTDQTYQVAASLMRTIPNLFAFRTVDNHARKAGGLNQAIRLYCQDSDFVMVMDADTTAAPNVVSEAVRILSDPSLGAICALTHLTPLPQSTSLDQKILWQLQKLEYASADSKRVEYPEDFQILAGSCVVYKMIALESVAKKRGNGQYYDETNLIEDYELTLTLKELGWKVTIGTKMHSWTDVPIYFHILWQQRIRWARSHVDTLRRKGWNQTTKRDILGHATFSVLITQQLIFLSLMIYLFVGGFAFVWNPLLWVIIASFWLDRMYRLKYVNNLSLTDVFVRALYVPEELYGLLHSVQRIWSYWLSFTDKPEEWLET